MPGPYGRRAFPFPGQAAEPIFLTCCQDGWLARGWFCRWCGRDEESGRQETARGIYDGRSNDWSDMPSHCECGYELQGWNNLNVTSCGSCYWVLTRQFVRHLLEVIGPWSHIHERIFIFLIESRTYSDTESNDAMSRAEDLAEVRLYGLHSMNAGIPNIHTCICNRCQCKCVRSRFCHGT